MTTTEVQATVTDIYRQNAEAYAYGKYRRTLNEGGTAASKTFSIMQVGIFICQSALEPLLFSTVSESMPHLKRGAIRDFFNILEQAEDNNPNWNKTDKIYRWGNGSKMEFFPADAPAKQRGARRDILFINECNNVSYEAYRELDKRTALFTFLDWNPVAEFWAHDHLKPYPDENLYIHSTYLDAKNVLPPEVVANIESERFRDPDWFNIYGLGRLGRVSGLVYPYWEIVEKLPQGDVFYGLDFGFTNDPTVLVACVILPPDQDSAGMDRLYCREVFYETGLTNDVIAMKMDLAHVRHNYDEIWADNAEPKSIQEICDKQFNVKPTTKGQGSVEYGHNKVKQFKQFWTQDSVFCIKEQKNFKYIPDKDGKLTEKTTHFFSHGMDARRYAVMSRGTASAKPRSKRAPWNRG